MRYPGGKNCAGTYQTIINQIPPHDTFVELFAGSAAITRHKRPAWRTILIDKDGGALQNLAGHLPPGTICLNVSALNWLELPCRIDPIDAGWFLYVDPPYLSVRCRYAYDLSPAEHYRLLKLLKDLISLVEMPLK